MLIMAAAYVQQAGLNAATFSNLIAQWAQLGQDPRSGH